MVDSLLNQFSAPNAATLFSIFIGAPTTYILFLPSHHLVMPMRKDILSDGDDANDTDSPTLPPNKKVKTSLSQKGSGAHSATSASASKTCPRTASAKQAALSNTLLFLICILGANWRSKIMIRQLRKTTRFKLSRNN
jgi:hypothetical protein